MKGIEEIRSFHIVSNEWLEEIKPQLKESSIVKYVNILNLYLIPEFGQMPVPKISREAVLTFRGRLLASGRGDGEGLAPTTAAGIISVLKRVLKYAGERECTVADISSVCIRQSRKPLRILCMSEQQRLSDHLHRDLSLSNLGILLSLYTGIRIGEICALKWEDVSFEEKTLYVHRTLQRLQTLQKEERKTAIRITRPKSDSSVRKIPIPDDLCHVLFEKRGSEDTYVLTGKSGIFVEPRTMENRFHAVMEACDLKGATFHTCRHTFATRCVELGFDVKSLSEILGHSNVNITMNRYVHPSMELKREQMSRLSKLFPSSK